MTRLQHLILGLVTLLSTLAGLLLVTFLIGHVMPIDPVVALVGNKAGAATYDAARLALGLDQPLWRQFGHYVLGLARGDIGQSIVTGRPVAEGLARAVPATLELSLLAILAGVAVGVPAGCVAAARHGGWPDQLVRGMALIGTSMPIFWLGLMGLLLFYAHLHWAGGPGRIDLGFRREVPLWSGLMLVDCLHAGSLAALRSALAHLLLPVTLLGGFCAAQIARMTRGMVIDELRRDYVLTARLKGAGAVRVMRRHILPNLAVPLLTVIALALAQLLEGAVLTETVFAWPGLGLYITKALFAADLPAVLGGTLVVGVCFVLLNKAVDLAYPLLDPRVRR